MVQVGGPALPGRPAGAGEPQRPPALPAMLSNLWK